MGFWSPGASLFWTGSVSNTGTISFYYVRNSRQWDLVSGWKRDRSCSLSSVPLQLSHLWSDFLQQQYVTTFCYGQSGKLLSCPLIALQKVGRKILVFPTEVRCRLFLHSPLCLSVTRVCFVPSRAALSMMAKDRCRLCPPVPPWLSLISLCSSSVHLISASKCRLPSPWEVHEEPALLLYAKGICLMSVRCAPALLQGYCPAQTSRRNNLMLPKAAHTGQLQIWGNKAPYIYTWFTFSNLSVFRPMFSHAGCWLVVVFFFVCLVLLFFFFLFLQGQPLPFSSLMLYSFHDCSRSRDKSSKLKRNVCSLRWQDGYSWHVHATTCTAVMNAVGWHRYIMLVGC